MFINYRRIDTNKNVAGLLYDHFSRLNLRPFLDSKSMKPGDKLFKKIDAAIRNCQVCCRGLNGSVLVGPGQLSER